MKNLITHVAIVLVFISCQSNTDKKHTVIQNSSINKYWPTNKWQKATPESQGLNSDSLIKAFDIIKNKGSIVIIKNGFLVGEYYPQGVDTSYLNNVYSCTKSVTSILTGIAIDKKIIKSESDKLVDYFADYSLAYNDSVKQSITLHHVLSMSSGLDWKGGVGGDNLMEMVLNQPDWNQYILDRQMADKPGTHFNYNSGCSQLLSAVIQRESGVSTKEFGEEFLFKPLGIHNYTWDMLVSPKGITPGAWGLFLTTRDMAKIGYLYLNNGEWDGKQIVSKQWVEKSIRSYNNRGINRHGYGYQWWILSGYPIFTYSASGHYHEHYASITVLPELNLVVATSGKIPSSLKNKIIKSYILSSDKIDN